MDIEEIDTAKLKELADQGLWADIMLKRGAPGAPYDGPATFRMTDGSKIDMNVHVRESKC